MLRCNRVEYVENIVFRGVEQFGHTAQNNEHYGYTPDIHIYLSQIGIEKDTIRRMLVFDVELYFTTEYLKKKGEKPYSIRRNMNFRNEYDTAD